MSETEGARERLLAAIRATPGASTRDLARLVGATEWTADYHLHRLSRSGAVSSENVGRARCWYAAACGLCPVLRRAVPALRRQEAVAVAMAVDETPATIPDIAERAGIAVGSARWAAGVLEDAFVVERSRYGRVRLRDGAATCVAAATSGQRCGLWGKCPVSREWERLRPRSDPRAPTLRL